MTSIIIAAPLVTGAPTQGAPAAASSVPSQEAEAEKAARAWIALVDAGQWDASWDAAGTTFRSRLPKAGWGPVASEVRRPLGAVSSRVLDGVVHTRSLPGAPDGDYRVVTFATRFARKSGAVETVILNRETGGWKVDGYFIR